MRDRPTFFERHFRSRNGVIKTRDGRYFVVNGTAKKEIPPIITASLIAMLGGAVIVLFADPDWLQPILSVYMLALALYVTALLVLNSILHPVIFSEPEDGAARYSAPRNRSRQEATTNDRPTYKDYLLHEQDGYIRSGGRYFAITEERKSIASIIVSILVFTASVAAVIWVFSSSNIWPVWIGEVYLFMSAFHLIQSLWQFRSCRFIPVPEDTPAWRDAQALEYSPQKKIIYIVAQAVVLIMVIFGTLSGGYTISLIRSQLDSGGTVSAEFSADDTGTFYEESHVTDEIVQVPISDPSGGDVRIDITVVHTPETARLSLDGKPLPDEQQPDKTQNIFDLQNYFLQEAYFDISGKLLHDGSTLTLNCGSLHREWVFDVTDKEDA